MNTLSNICRAVNLHYQCTSQKSLFTKVTHVIFDLDGTLVNTEVIYESVMKQIANSYGKEFPFELRMQVLGRTEMAAGELMVNTLELPITVDEYLEEYHNICNKLFSETKLMKGVRRLICHLDANKIPIAIATSSSTKAVEIKTSRYIEFFKLFKHIVCGSSDPEVKNGKPAPDIFLVAAERFPDKPNPEQCLVFEDAPNGVEGAKAAGMQVVMIPAPTTPDELRKEATLVLNSMEEFKPELFGLPAYPC